MSAIPAEESDQLLIRPLTVSAAQLLYSETDIVESMAKIETMDFCAVKEVARIKFWCYHKGHVLGAAMFMIEIASVKVLYTGDYSRQEDRHLMAAEIPDIKPDIFYHWQSNSNSGTCAEFRIKYVGAIEKLKLSDGKSLEGPLDLINYIDVAQQDGKLPFVPLEEEFIMGVSKYSIKVPIADQYEQAQAICKVLATAFDSVLTSEKS